MAKFKVGDRVVCTERSSFGFPGEVGKEYVVASVNGSGNIALVGEGDSHCEASRFKLVKKKSEEAAAKPNFKPGDRVRLVEDCRLAKAGAMATVGPRGMFGEFVDIKFDRNGHDGGMPDGGYYPHQFILVSRDAWPEKWPDASIAPFVPASATPTTRQPVSVQVDAIDEEYGPVVTAATTSPAIVCLMKNGRPLPAKEPFVHADPVAASKEADRLAKKHRGEEFAVYVLAATRKDDPPTAKFKVGDHVSVRRAFGRVDRIKTAAFINGKWQFTLHKMHGFYLEDDIDAVKFVHEWQRLAQTGQRGAAIRIIHEKTGLPLEHARLAVNSWADAMMIGRI